MKPHTCYPLDLESTDIVEVTLSGWANVILLDDINYRNYRKRKRFAYTGGLAKTSPFSVSPPRSGKWNLVIDIPGVNRLKASFRIIRQAEKQVKE